MTHPLTRSTLFPYTTLFRSTDLQQQAGQSRCAAQQCLHNWPGAFPRARAERGSRTGHCRSASRLHPGCVPTLRRGDPQCRAHHCVHESQQGEPEPWQLASPAQRDYFEPHRCSYSILGPPVPPVTASAKFTGACRGWRIVAAVVAYLSATLTTCTRRFSLLKGCWTSLSLVLPYPTVTNWLGSMWSFSTRKRLIASARRSDRSWLKGKLPLASVWLAMTNTRFLNSGLDSALPSLTASGMACVLMTAELESKLISRSM